MNISQIHSQDKLDLKKIMDNFKNYEDNTEYIRKVKHSELIKKDISIIASFKKEKKNENMDLFKEELSLKCSFLYTHYLDVFNKMLKDEIDCNIMMSFLEVLKMIEDGKLEQQEGSVMIGKILKNLFLDSAVRHADNLDKEHAKNSEKTPVVSNKGTSEIKWATYKKNKKTT